MKLASRFVFWGQVVPILALPEAIVPVSGGSRRAGGDEDCSSDYRQGRQGCNELFTHNSSRKMTTSEHKILGYEARGSLYPDLIRSAERSIVATARLVSRVGGQTP